MTNTELIAGAGPSLDVGEKVLLSKNQDEYLHAALIHAVEKEKKNTKCLSDQIVRYTYFNDIHI